MRIYQNVILSSLAISKIHEMVKDCGGNEIGGPMVGFVTTNQDLLITDVEGPGPKGKCLPFKVTIDGEHAQKFCDLAYQNTCGFEDFVGDWHCHPGISMRPSEGDRLAMKLLADTPGLVPNPVSLIYSKILKKYRVYEWSAANQCLVKIPVQK